MFLHAVAGSNHPPTSKFLRESFYLPQDAFISMILFFLTHLPASLSLMTLMGEAHLSLPEGELREVEVSPDGKPDGTPGEGR